LIFWSELYTNFLTVIEVSMIIVNIFRWKWCRILQKRLFFD